MNNVDETIMSLTEIANQPTEDGVIQQTIRDALELINYQHEHIDAFLKDQEKIVLCKDCKYCKYPKSEKEWCKKGHLHRNAETWFCADGERR